MASQEINVSRHDDKQSPNPWEKFTRQDPAKYVAEDARLNLPLGFPNGNEWPPSAEEVIERFLTHTSNKLERPIPRRRQVLRDYLNEAIKESIKPFGGQTVEQYIIRSSFRKDVALLDDRRKHPQCAKLRSHSCNDCNIHSTALNILRLYLKLSENRKTTQAEKRIIFIPDLTSIGALALAATTARRTAKPLCNFLHRYLVREHHFSVSISWGFFLEFHVPYHALRRGQPINDHRTLLGKPLRTCRELPLRSWSADGEELYFYEAQTSSLSLGPDEWFWTEYFLVDTYFGSEPKLRDYLRTSWPDKELSDPPLGGWHSLENACFDPREYWLLKVERRIHQVFTEYDTLIKTFIKRMDDYEMHIENTFHDDPNLTHTQTLSKCVSISKIFANCIKATVDAWKTFDQNQIKFFKDFAHDQPTWETRIDNIKHHMAELDRLRNDLLMKCDHLDFKLTILHTASSVRHTEVALSQARNIKTLTKLTAFVAFPLLFTIAFYPSPVNSWLVFLGAITSVAILNYNISSSLGDVSFQVGLNKSTEKRNPIIDSDIKTTATPIGSATLITKQGQTRPFSSLISDAYNRSSLKQFGTFHNVGLKELWKRTRPPVAGLDENNHGGAQRHGEEALPRPQRLTSSYSNDNKEQFEEDFVAILFESSGFLKIWLFALERVHTQVFHTALVNALRYYATEVVGLNRDPSSTAAAKLIGRRSEEITRRLWVRIIDAFGEDEHSKPQPTSQTTQIANEIMDPLHYSWYDGSTNIIQPMLTELNNSTSQTTADPQLSMISASSPALQEGEEQDDIDIPPFASVSTLITYREPFLRLRSRLIYTILPSRLHLAVFDDNFGLVCQLIQQDIDILSTDNESLGLGGQSLIDLALSNASTNIIIRLLKKYGESTDVSAVDQAFRGLSSRLKSSSSDGLSVSTCESWEKFAILSQWYQEERRRIDIDMDFSHHLDHLLIFKWEVPLLLSVIGRSMNSGPSPRQTTNKTVQIHSDQIHALDNVVTITGDGIDYEAATCREYLEKHFGQIGQDALDLAKTALGHVNTIGKFSRPHYGVYFCAHKHYLVIRCFDEGWLKKNRFEEAIRWLCQALRLTPDKASSSLWVSEISKSISIKSSLGSIKVFPFELLKTFMKDSLGTTGCWTDLFGEGVVARQPISRTWGRGLGLSFSMMTQLADVHNYKWIEGSSQRGNPEGGEEGGYIMIGFFSALIPVTKSQDGTEMQWHLECTGDHLIGTSNLRSLQSSWLKVDGPADLETSTCYLGWCDIAHILLGTKKIDYKIGWTGLSKRNRTLHRKGYTAVGQLGVNAGLIPIVVQGGQNYEYVNNKQRFTAPESYAKAIQVSQQHVALVYDNAFERAWLVPKLSLMLHLCHMYFRFFHPTTYLDPVPFAKPSCDGSGAAADALYDKGDIEISRHGSQDGDVIKLRNVLIDISNNLFDTRDIREDPSSSFLFGAEVMDSIAEPGNGSVLRKVPVNDCASSWLSLARAADCISVCANLGPAIEPAGASINCDCKIVQPGKKYLGAHLSCLDTILRRGQHKIHDLQNSTVKLDDKEEWCFNSYRPCPHSTQHSIWKKPENFLQSFSSCSFSFFTQKKPPKHAQAPLKSGAVIFGQPEPNKLKK